MNSVSRSLTSESIQQSCCVQRQQTKIGFDIIFRGISQCRQPSGHTKSKYFNTLWVVVCCICVSISCFLWLRVCDDAFRFPLSLTKLNYIIAWESRFSDLFICPSTPLPHHPSVYMSARIALRHHSTSCWQNDSKTSIKNSWERLRHRKKYRRILPSSSTIFIIRQFLYYARAHLAPLLTHSMGCRNGTGPESHIWIDVCVCVYVWKV